MRHIYHNKCGQMTVSTGLFSVDNMPWKTLAPSCDNSKIWLNKAISESEND